MLKNCEVNPDENTPKEFIRKNSILKHVTTINKPGLRILKKHSESPYKRSVSFADRSNNPIQTVINFEPFKYEKEYLNSPATPSKPKKSAKCCTCLIF